MKPTTQQLLMRLSARGTELDRAWAQDARELVELGLAREHTARDGRRMLQLTSEGKRNKAALQASRPARRAANLHDLHALEQRLVLRIEALIDARLSELEPRLRTMPPALEVAVTSDGLAARVLAALQELDQQQQLDGIVPLPALRAHLGDVPAAVLDRELMSLERQYRIDLKIANDPTTVVPPSAGIRLPGRGLAWFAALR